MPSDVLVIGAGVAGIQAALDLADMGIHVHLVEKRATVGGRMVQLDTIFPTRCQGGCRHCSIDITSGEPTDCSRHPYITLHTCSEIESITGSVGNFRARLLKHAQYVDEEACTACGDCSEVCPVSVPDEFNEGLSLRKAIYRTPAQAVPDRYLISKRGTAACQDACPAGTSAQGYLALIAQGRYTEALEVIKEYNPFPATVGRVCSHPCESACERARVDEPVAICALKRFVADWVYADSEQPDVDNAEVRVSPGAKRVAIVGAGPAGLSAAHFLAREGYRVTVFEALSVAGGMMRLTIPSYRLPRDVLQREIDAILALGVQLRLYHPISDLDALLEQGFDAVLLAIGAHEPQLLGIPGEETRGVFQGLPFLRSVSLGEQVELGDQVVVIGDDNTAIYAARSALRLGASRVTIASQSARQEIRAIAQEVREAEIEGIQIEFQVRPEEILSENGRVSGVRLARLQPKQPAEGRNNSAAAGREAELGVDADCVIISVTNVPELSFLKSDHGLAVGPQNTIQVDPQTLATNRQGVFAAGDVAHGPDILIQAIADGRRAARSIDCYLRGVSLLESEDRAPNTVVRLTESQATELAIGSATNSIPRQTMPTQPATERIRDFREVALGLTEEQARAEARRCLQCGLCADCGLCVHVCEPHCIDLSMHDETIELDV